MHFMYYCPDVVATRQRFEWHWEDPESRSRTSRPLAPCPWFFRHTKPSEMKFREDYQYKQSVDACMSASRDDTQARDDRASVCSKGRGSNSHYKVCSAHPSTPYDLDTVTWQLELNGRDAVSLALVSFSVVRCKTSHDVFHSLEST